MKRIKLACRHCLRPLRTRDERRDGCCMTCQFVQAHIDLAECVIGVPSRAITERRAS